MADDVIARIPVVGGLGYVERVRRLPASFTAELRVEPGNRYFHDAIAVHSGEDKVGYLAPEVARRYFEPLQAHGQPVTCPARRATTADHETSGVEVLLDFTALSVQASE